MNEIAKVGLAMALGATGWAVWVHRDYLLAINPRDGCYPWSPKVVPFHQGMTICPGQAAVVTIVIPQ